MKENMLTQSGKDLWTRVNIEHGSSTWGYVGDGIIAIEEEMRQTIANEIWQRHVDGSQGGVGQWTNHHGLSRCDCEEVIAFIKKEEISG